MVVIFIYIISPFSACLMKIIILATTVGIDQFYYSVPYSYFFISDS
jgi:hypothetical protein